MLWVTDKEGQPAGFASPGALLYGRACLSEIATSSVSETGKLFTCPLEGCQGHVEGLSSFSQTTAGSIQAWWPEIRVDSLYCPVCLWVSAMLFTPWASQNLLSLTGEQELPT